jgi:cyclopropane fatty-acyl-phospholipid synthase-like methyltransferase
MSSNQFNKEQYDSHASMYIKSNRSGTIGGGNIQQRIGFLKDYLPLGSSIIEIGSGDGSEAQGLIDAGYKVTASDFSDAFTKILQEKNIPTKHFDVLSDTPTAQYSCIYTNAVFVHITHEDLKSFFERCKSQVDKGTILFATFLKGVGSERSARGRGFERDFYYYEETEIRELISDIGLEVIYLEVVENKWIWLIAQF